MNKINEQIKNTRLTFGCLMLILGFVACNPTPKITSKNQEVKHADSLLTVVKIAQSETVQMLEKAGMLNLKNVDPSIRVELKYATEDNFVKQVLYVDFKDAYLQPMAAMKLKDAQRRLKAKCPDLSLLVYDAVRPQSVQTTMYNTVKGTKYQAYVADPKRTGLHNYGVAVDLTICNDKGVPLDMGTKFDYFGRKAGIREEPYLVKVGLLSQVQMDNRLLLRTVMQSAGFIPIKGEWWHFNACSLAEAKKKFGLIK